MSSDIAGLISEYRGAWIALYGLGTETQRFIAEHGDGLSLVGLLDGFRTDGEMYGYPIISLEETIERKVKCIIVIARPGSCKAIRKRIGAFCEQNGISLYDVRGKDLLAPADVAYDFSAISGYKHSDLMKKIEEADIVSFDLFDTLITRRVYQYTDVFELIDIKLKDKGIIIPELSKLRIAAEKELSRQTSPKLADIYEEVINNAGDCRITAEELSQMEWETDISLMTKREKVCDTFCEAVRLGKEVVITTDCYYSAEQIGELLVRFDVLGYNRLFVSSEYRSLKTHHLFDKLVEQFPDKRILHIGDDEKADIECAGLKGIDTFRIYSGMQLFDALGGLGLDEGLCSVSDRVKTGLFISRIFNDPFVFEDEEQRLVLDDATDIGYLFGAPMITDFVHWMSGAVDNMSISQILFGARDGYLIKDLYEMINRDKRSVYFYTSRTAAIRAGMQTLEDIEYIDGMKYSGTIRDAVKMRFGIELSKDDSADKTLLIFKKADHMRANYRKYIDKLELDDGDIAFFDFVAKGTTQMYLQRMFSQNIKGVYFLQLEPEFMAGKGLDVEPFFTDEEKNTSAIFDNYYILETILTSPDPQMLEMDENGNPVFAKETRSNRDIRTLERMQSGITEYFKDFIETVPESSRTINKHLDEMILALLGRVRITDEDFLALTVEDPFFGRMTDIKDVI